ncbi:MAG TPA: sigma-70 family RNA polymerase sigma factor [Thermoanaerobaculia bacterium]|nr:sigma-70 family RNA polymerase sigma factor [Thermoanaerobaculia bacterium]
MSYFALRSFHLPADDVEDLVQEVLLRFMDSSAARRMAGEAHSPGPYIARMLRNAALDLLRKRERQQRLAFAPEAAVVPDEVERLNDQIDMHRMVAVIRELSPEDQELIRLRFLEGRTLSEIAERHGIAVSTVFSRLRQILVSIRGKLDKSPG